MSDGNTCPCEREQIHIDGGIKPAYVGDLNTLRGEINSIEASLVESNGRKSHKHQ